jgi:predicted PurR-regulated permease PerM
MQSWAFFLGILGLMFFLTWTIFKPFLIFMVVGVLVAVLALPIDRLWEKILPNRIAAFGTLLTIFILITGPMVGLGFALYGDVEDGVQAIEDGSVEVGLNQILDVVYPGQNATERNETIDSLWDEARPKVEDALRSVISSAVGVLADFLIALTVILFVAYYVLTDGEKLAKFLRRAAPLPPKQVDFLLAEGHNGLKAVFYGQILTSLIQGGLGGIGFLIAGVPGAIIWAAVMAVLSLLPVVGAFIVWVPAALFLFIKGDTWQAVFLTAWGFMVVSQIDNFVRPKLIGDRADIHPLFVLIGVLGGVAAFGFVGLFLGPLLVGITVSILRVWETDYLDPSLTDHVHEDGSVHDHEEIQIGQFDPDSDEQTD